MTPSHLTRIRERVALAVAPWLYVPYREDREEAFRDLAEIAYLSRDAVWTSPRTLVRTALEEAGRRGASQWLMGERVTGRRPADRNRDTLPEVDDLV